MESSTSHITSYSIWIGSACCLMSAVGYSCANICLRQLAELEADPAWMICLKESVAVLVVGPWLILRGIRGPRRRCRQRALVVLILAALGVQLLGNLSIQWSFGIVGLAITMPVVFGTVLIGSAVIGLTHLQESLSKQSIAAILMVTVSIILLSFGATSQANAASTESGPFLTALAVAASCLAGAVYAAMGAALRYSTNNGIPVPITIVVVTGTGSISLGAICVLRLGPRELLATDSSLLPWIVTAGLCNVIAFAFITNGIRLTTLVHANLLNAAQVALGALAGVFIFSEPHDGYLIAGLLLTIAGIISFGSPEKKKQSEK